MKSFEFKKSLGQNFLVDKNIIDKIVNTINLNKDDLVIEVGPGSGALTKEIVKKAQVLCFEIDKRLEPELSLIKGAVCVFEDFLKVEIEKHLSCFKYNKLYFIANLPYYITTPIIEKVLFETNAEELVLMMQKEVANRISSPHNSRNYNSLSVFLQYNFEIEKVCLVSRNSFIPRPGVDSIVLKFIRNKRTKAKNEDKFYQFVRDSFKFKRKNLRNNLKDYDLEKLDKILNSLGKDLTCRAESISINDFVKISNEYF